MTVNKIDVTLMFVGHFINSQKVQGYINRDSRCPVRQARASGSLIFKGISKNFLSLKGRWVIFSNYFRR